MKALISFFASMSFCLGEQSVDVSELASLFDQGKYEEAVQASKGAYDLGERETALYVAAASSSLLGEYRDAVFFSKRYLNEFPKGKYLVEIGYYYGVSLARLGYREQADHILEQLVDSAGSSYQQRSLYELALLAFNAADYEATHTYLDQLLLGDIDGALQVQAHLLYGQVAEARRERELAEKHYLAAYERAKSIEGGDQQAECLFYLIAFYGREKIAGEANPEMAKALPYYTVFDEGFSDSEYYLQALSASFPALEEAGRIQEGVDKLDAAIKKLLASGGEAGLRDGALSLLWARLGAGEKLSEIKKELISAEGSDSKYSAIMRYALAQICSIGADQAHLSWGKQLKYRALENGLRCSLLQLPDIEALPSFVLLDMGELLLDSQSVPYESAMYFEVAAESSNGRQKLEAELGLARALIQQGNGSYERALKILRDIDERAEGDIELLDISSYEQMKALDVLASWDELEREALGYLANKRFKKHRNQVHFFLAKSYDKRGKVEDAIANYTQIFTAATGELRISAPTVARLSELTWQRNTPAKGEQLSDRQIAYQLAQRYLSLIEGAPEWQKQLAEVQLPLSQIQANIELWEQSGEVQSVDEILEQMRKGERPIIRK